MKRNLSQQAIDAINRFSRKDKWFGEFTYLDEKGLFVTGLKGVLSTDSSLRGLAVYGVEVGESSFKIDAFVSVAAEDEKTRERLNVFVERANESLENGSFYLMNGETLAFKLEVPCDDEISDLDVVRAFLTPAAAFRVYESVFLGIVDRNEDVPEPLVLEDDKSVRVILETLVCAHECGL